MINLTTAFNIFFWVTFIFFNFKFFMNTNNDLKKNLGWNIGFLVFIMIIMGFVNDSLMSSLCNGNSNTGVVAYATLPTWIIMFGLMICMITVFPGWKSPFANTFGYFLLVLSGYKSKLETYIHNEIDVKYNYIYKNPLIIINEFDPSNVNMALDTETIKTIFKLDTEESRNLIIKLVLFKDLVSEFMWFILTGMIIITVSYNIISSNNCNNTKTLDDQNNDIQNALASVPDGTQENTRIYNITE
jgi:hypothetical protein